MAGIATRIVIGACACIPAMVVEAATSMGLCAGSALLKALFGTRSDVDLLKEEVTMLRFEMDEIHHTDWIVVESELA